MEYKRRWLKITCIGLLLPGCLQAQVSLPLKRLQLTSVFGNRIHPVTGQFAFHSGVDLHARSDTVFAVLPGIVEAEGFDPFLGIFIRLRHGEFQTIYGHLSQLFVFKGDSVQLNGVLGITGITGRVTGEHLHFEVKCRGRPIDPLVFLLALYKKINNK